MSQMLVFTIIFIAGISNEGYSQENKYIVDEVPLKKG